MLTDSVSPKRFCCDCFGTDRASGTTNSKAITLDEAVRHASEPSGFKVHRLLRVHKTTAAPQEGEERLFGLKLGKVDDLIENTKVTMQLNDLKSKETKLRDAFTALNVDKVTNNLLESKEWTLLVRYTKMTHKEDPEEALVSVMTFKLSGDGFSKMLANAMKDSNTKEVAKALEATQLKWWLKQDYSPQQILETQKLDKGVDAVLDGAPFAMWLKHLEAYNKKHLRDGKMMPQTTLDIFTAKYGEEGFLKLLGQLDDSPGATKFQDEIVKNWMANPDHPLNMFKRLKLDEAGDGLLTNPLLSIWTKYMQEFNKEYKFAQTTMIQTFTKSYGDEKMATMIQAAMKVPETEQFAKNLQSAQFEQWMMQNKSPDDIYKKVLKLDSNDSPKADIWRAYHNAYEEKYPGKLFSFSP
ncbi:unnamed protein product [Phytophthora fragariaefolia]|uniref:Unnamed protein product n=1 Tax=Phytophthora fragariaefolia TaxID=1490495 RepID=A0A9W6Y6Z2_9STRA|nr:unnamed protein product [Phytophthora fragariaefolia]